MINNIYWVGTLHSIGGVETAIYELAKEFTDYDFVIYYNNIPKEQLKRLKKYVRCIKYKGEKLKCKKLFMNYDISIIDNVEAEEYIEIVHCVFSKNVVTPHTHKKITRYYAVGKEACESFKKITGCECEVLHNLLEIEKPQKVLRLISATRLASDKGKIVKRMQQFVDALEMANIPYQWNIFTNGERSIKGNGIAYMPITLDIRNYIADSDYTVQLSDTEAFCYTVLESLYLNVPVIVTPIQCFEEMKVENGKNGYILDYDMKNIPIKEIYYKKPKFSYQPFKNEWVDKIVKVKGNYKEEREMEVKVKAIINFTDIEENVKRKVGEEFICGEERAEYLKEHNAVEILETIKPVEAKVEYHEEKEEPKVELKVAEKKSKKKKSSKK